MNQSQQEQLSAFIDGELERDASRFLLKRLDTDSELRAAWQRWHLAGSCLRGQPGYRIADGFAEAIAARVAVESTPSTASPMRSVLRWTAGLAVAASVAMLALVVVQPEDRDAASEQLALASQPADAVVAASPLRAEDLRPNLGNATQTVAGVRTQLLGPALPVDPRLDAYLIRHGAALGASGSVQALPYVQLLQAPSRTPIPAREANRGPQR